ncbi:MAG: SPFH domain-containing protein [Pseudomonadota bacterium]
MEFIMGLTCLGAAAGVGVLALLFIAKQFLFVAKPNEVLVVSGRRGVKQLTDGSRGSYQAVFSGRVWRKPFLEEVDRMDLQNIPIEVKVVNAYSKGGIPLKVHAVANVKVTSSPRLIMNAIERFLGRDPAEIRRVAKETLEGHLRGVLARLTPEEVNEDRLKFADELLKEANEDFHKLGIELDTLKVQNVADDIQYLDSIGRKQIAMVVRDAEIAESNARAEAERVEANCNQQGQVADQNSETAIVKKANALRQYKGEMEARARSEEERMQQMVLQARAEAEIELQEIRQKLEKTRLIAEQVLPAEAQRQASALRARGQAAAIEENGRALAEVLEMMTTAWLSAGDDAKDIFLLQQLETVLSTVVQRVKDVQINEVTLLDAGDGKALPAHVASYPAMVKQILSELREYTGVDVPGILSGLNANRVEVR